MPKPIEVDFDKFMPSLHQFFSYYHIMKELGLIEDVKIEIDPAEGPTIMVNSILSRDQRNIFS
ncbi:MAG: hypothetical protein JW776_00760 [Candidatus Lokiarchaeota archaeon]|nr:hypothetical protein [Candidatus Lokiarchaeota archaeon]